METVSVVIPCFRGEKSLFPLLRSISELTFEQSSAGQVAWRVSEVLLVWDGGSEQLADTILELSKEYDFVRPVWLSRNFGQHAATCAGLKHSSAKWAVTLDEDGQHTPAEISLLLDHAKTNANLLVYARDSGFSATSRLRNWSSKFAKALVARLLGVPSATDFQSFRLIDGNIAREVAHRSAPMTYLDVALSWFVSNPGVVETSKPTFPTRPSGYSLRSLVSHFWSFVTTAGPRALRILSYIGLVASAIGLSLTLYFAIQAINGANLPEGWTSQIAISLMTSGLILMMLGVIAEYVSQLHGAILGRPAYFEVAGPPEPEWSDAPKRGARQ